MATIVTRAGKGSPLTNTEVDANFTNLNTDKAELSGATFTGEIVADAGIALGDNDKATFGAGDDLQIYHNGNNSFIEDTGAGNLYVRAASNIFLQGASNNTMAQFVENGFVKLFHNTDQKLSTTATGIDVTGTATMDGLTVDGLSQLGTVSIYDSGTNATVAADSGHDLEVRGRAGQSVNIFSNGTKTATFDSVGDVSFYEDTGTTAKFFWDASAESLAIGTGATSAATINAYSKTVATNLPSALRVIENTGASSYWDIGSTGGASNNLNFYANANTTPKLTLTGSGFVGIGTSSPSHKLSVSGSNSAARFSDDGTGYSLDIEHDTTNGITTLQQTNSGGDLRLQAGVASGLLMFDTGGSERMRIISDGRLLVGQTAVSTGGSNGDDAQVYVNGGVVREGVIFDDFDNVWVQTNGAIIEGRSNFAPSNKPNTENWFFVTAGSIHTGGLNVYCVQTATSITGRIYTRYNNNVTNASGTGTWSSWVEK